MQSRRFSASIKARFNKFLRSTCSGGAAHWPAHSDGLSAEQRAAGTGGMTVGKSALRPDQSALSIGSGVRYQFAALVQKHRRPLCFLVVGALGLATDIALFTILAMLGAHTLLAGALALVAATVLTWRLNRTFTFDRSGRR